MSRTYFSGENEVNYEEEYMKCIRELDDIVHIKTDEDKKEEILDPKANRFTLLPIQYPNIWKFHKKQEAASWQAGEIDYTNEDKHFEELLNEDEKYFIKHILAFFASSDGIVNLNIMRNFSKDVTILEAQIAYQFQGMIENVHSEVYSILIDTYIKDIEEKHKLFNAIKYMPCIFNKMKWAIKWLKSNDRFAYRVVAFAIVEGLFFSGSFCAIYWLKQRNPLKALSQANELIARDEGMHTEFACLLYSMLQNKLAEEEVQNMIKEAVTIEKEFICESLPCKMIGMNSDLMCQYIEYVADHLLGMLGYNKIYNSTNPFIFMEMISVDNKTNFFESKTSEYQKSSVINQGKTAVSFTDDF